MVNTLGRSLFNGKPTGAHRAKVLVVQPVCVINNMLPSLMNEIVAGCPIKTVRTAYVAGKVGCYFQVYGATFKFMEGVPHAVNRVWSRGSRAALT